MQAARPLLGVVLLLATLRGAAALPLRGHQSVLELGVASVVLPALPNCVERAAAAELRREIAMLTLGSPRPLPPLLYEPQPTYSHTPRIFVGNTSASHRVGLPPRPPRTRPSYPPPTTV